MRKKNLFLFALKTVLANRKRFFLSSLGIIIGIIAQTISMSACLSYIRNTENVLMMSGASIIQISINSIDEVDAIDEIVQNMSLLKAAMPYSEKEMDILVNGTKRKSRIIFTTNKYLTVENINIIAGECNIDSTHSIANTVVINDNLADVLFKGIPSNQEIEIAGIPFKINGYINDGRMNSDSVCYLNYDFLHKYNLEEDNSSWLIVCDTLDLDIVNEIQSDISEYLNGRYHDKLSSLSLKYSDNMEFEEVTNMIYTMSSSVDEFEVYKNDITITKTIMTVFFALLMVVGGIGIGNLFNILYSGRHGEIGIAKAVGATKSRILYQFFIEIGIITSFAVVIGSLLGIVLTYAFGLVAGINITLSWEWILISIGVASLLSITMGLWPAIKCIKLDPIKAINSV